MQQSYIHSVVTAVQHKIQSGSCSQEQFLFMESIIYSNLRFHLAQEYLDLANASCNIDVINWNKKEITRYEASGEGIPS